MTIETNRQQNIKEVAEYIIDELANTIERTTRTCLNCTHFYETTEICELAGSRPPAKVIAFGCPKFEEPIPF